MLMGVMVVMVMMGVMVVMIKMIMHVRVVLRGHDSAGGLGVLEVHISLVLVRGL